MYLRPPGLTVIVDLATGLMWSTGSSKEYTYAEAAAHAQSLDQKRWSGFTGWRLPTTEELLSLIESAPFPVEERNLDNRLFITGTEWWSVDASAGPGVHWAVTADGRCHPLKDRIAHGLRVVRNMTTAEVEQARREYKPPIGQ